jgi:hypothetical protein
MPPSTPVPAVAVMVVVPIRGPHDHRGWGRCVDNRLMQGRYHAAGERGREDGRSSKHQDPFHAAIKAAPAPGVLADGWG